MSRTPGVVALLLSAWISGLVVAAQPLGFERPLALRHPDSAMVPRFEPPPSFCEPLFAEAGCDIREDLSPEENDRLAALVGEHGAAVERWRREARWALLTSGYWRRPWPWFAFAWTALAAGLARLAVRARSLEAAARA